MLRRVTTWGWLLITLIMCYAVYNPTGLSLVGLWLRPAAAADPFVYLVTLALIIPLLMFCWHTIRTINLFGFLLFFFTVAIVLWALSTVFFPADLLNTAHYWAQIVIAVLLTLGLRLPKLRRDITSTVQVEDVDTGEE